MILSVTLNPSVDQVLFIERLVPHDTNRAFRTEIDAGGKGVNLSRIAVEMGAKSMATGFLGGGAGAYVRHVLNKQGVANDFVEIEGNTRTNFAVEETMVFEPPTTFNTPGPQICAQEWSDLIERVRNHAKDANWIALGGSMPPGVESDAFQVLGRLGYEFNLKVLLDADGEAAKRGLECKPHLIKPNIKEASRLLGRPIETLEQTKHAADILYEQIGGEDRIVIISRGAQGALMRTAEGFYNGLPPQVEAKSSIGSGDSMLGAILAKFEQGEGAEVAFRWGLAAGAATALTTGSEIGRKPVIDRLFLDSRVETI